MIFRLKGGCHVQGDKVYRKNDLIVTDTDLTKTFRGKFERVWSPEQLSPAELKVVMHLFPEYKPPVVDQPDIPTPAGTVDAGPTASPVPVPASEAAEPIKELDEEPPEPPADPDDVDEPEPVIHPKYGEQVNDVFPQSKQIGVDVYVKANWYRVVDRDDGQVLNDTSLRKNQVNDFLATYQPESDD